MKKAKTIMFKQVGRSIIAVVDSKKLTFTTADIKLRDKIKGEIEAFNLRPSDKRKKSIITLLTPMTEKKKTTALVLKKKRDNAVKEVKRQSIAPKARAKKLDNFFKGDNRFVLKDGEVFMVGYEAVALPSELVLELEHYIDSKTSIEPLVNFWMLALLNPNPVARTKMFAYLSRHKMIITPNGYFVTYRMVKKTDKKDIYTHAHGGGGKVHYEVGKATKIPRSQCDEDGGRDCSRGLHTGTPNFIGVELGDGYGGQGGSYSGQGFGTDYYPPANQSFNNSFGDQAVIVLVNPMHVVSVPDSDTRKLRACELYICKTTTPEEVIKLQTNAYHVYDNAYKNYEFESLKRMLKETKLKAFADKSNKIITTSSKKMQEEIRNIRKSIHFGQDAINSHLTLDEINSLIQTRVSKIAKKR